MFEKPHSSHNESIDDKALFADIEKARTDSVSSFEKNERWTRLVYQWDCDLKKKMEEKFSTTAPLQEVPTWQILVGGTVEDEVNITDEQRSFILQEIADFFYNELKPAMEKCS